MRRRDSQLHYAMKILLKDQVTKDSKSTRQIQNELEVMKLRHPFMVGLVRSGAPATAANPKAAG